MNRKVKPLRRNSHHYERLAVNPHRPANQVPVSAEHVLPQGMTQDHYSLACVLLLRQETTAQGGLHAEHREQIPGNNLTTKMERLSETRQREMLAAITDDVFEYLVILAK